MVAYRPAARSESMRTLRTPLTGSRLRDRSDGFDRARLLRPHDVDLPARLVLRYDVGEDCLPGLREFQDAAGQDRIFQLDSGERRADGLGLQRAGFPDSREERASGL